MTSATPGGDAPDEQPGTWTPPPGQDGYLPFPAAPSYPQQYYPGSQYPGPEYPGPGYPGPQQYYPGVPYQQYPGGPQYVYVVPGTSGFAVASLVCSFFGVIGAVLGPTFGFIALSQINRSGQQGRGMAIAGITIGFVWVGFLVLGLIIAASGG